MKKNDNSESDELRIIARLIKELSRLDEQEKKIRKAEKTKVKAIQDVLDRLCLKLEERTEKDNEISSLLRNLQETTSTLRTLLRH